MDPIAALEPVGAGVLSTVFIISGTAKIRTPYATAVAMVRFGLVRTVNPRAGRAAGIVELLTAGSILIWPSLPLTLAAACALLAFFVVLLAAALITGNRFPCACFGAHGSPLSLLMLARTLVLLGVAVGCLVPVTLGLSVEARDAQVAGLCIGAIGVCIVLLFHAVWRTGAFAGGFEASA